MAKKWKAGVIGCGAIAQALHLPGYMKAPGVELVSACDPVLARRREAKKLCPGLNLYDDHRKMLAAEQLDVISVCSPNCFHAEQACAALEAGAHVLLEKPAALSMKQIKSIKQAVRKSRQQLIVGFSLRLMTGNIKMHKLLEAGTIGNPFMIRIRLAHNGPQPGWAKYDWFYKPKLAGGGALLDMGIHAIDQAIWHLGPIRSVQAITGTLRKKIKLEDNALLLLEFARTPALGYIEVGWTSPIGFYGIEIMGDAGCMVADYAGALTVKTGKVTPDKNAKTNIRKRVVDKQAARGAWSIEVQEVIKAFRRNSNMGLGIEAGAASLAVALAAYESSRTGKRVLVSSQK